jgi:hypothetical protein
MSATVCTSSMSHRRIARARAWLKACAPAEEVLIIGANRDAANELARGVAQTTGAAFGWHRITLAQLAAVLAAPTMALRGIVSVGSLGAEAIVRRAMHALRSDDALGRYVRIAEGPGFARAIAGVLAEVRLAGLTPEALGDVDPDLLRLLCAYEAELTEGKLTDWPGLLAIATETAANSSSVARRWIELPKLLPEQGVTRYQDDLTEGPACAIAAGATYYLPQILNAGCQLAAARAKLRNAK